LENGTKQPDISVIIPTFNRRAIVARTLVKIFAQRLDPSRYEVIVVVDGSTDATAAMLKSLKPDCAFRVIEQENKGLAGGRNTGYKAARADLVLFLDDDMFSDPGLLAAHIDAHRERARSVAFGALFLSEDSPPSLAAECFRREIGAFHLKQTRDPEGAWQSSYSVFSNTSLSRTLLEEAGGFDETFRMREDFELGIRLFRMGVNPIYVGSAIAHQYYIKTSADLIRDAEEFAEADLLFARKHHGVPGHLQWQINANRLRQYLRRFVATWPAASDFILTPFCRLGDTLVSISLFRDLGVRALQLQRGIHWLHRVLEIEKPKP
jgi:GT2 family glycosyltransferase